MSLLRGTSHVSLTTLSILATSLLCGCALDIQRERVNHTLPAEQYEELEVGRSDLAQTLEALGAPDVIERETDANEDHLWWLHKDTSDISLRFQLPLSFFGYRHNVFQYFQGDDQTNKIHLVFDDAGRLKQKDLALPEEYSDDGRPPQPDRLHVAPRVEHSFLLSGSADLADYDDIFEDGSLIGLDVHYQPVTPLLVGLSGSFQHFDGRSFTNSAATFSFEDLELITAELVIHLQIPFETFENIFDPAEMRRVLLDDGPEHANGWLVFVEGGAGLTHNSGVTVTTAGAAARFFDSGAGFSNSVSAGVEYSMEYLNLRAGLNLRSVDAFEEGNSALPDRASGMSALMAMLSVSMKF